jgi:hypothetical protein
MIGHSRPVPVLTGIIEEVHQWFRESFAVHKWNVSRD